MDVGTLVKKGADVLVFTRNAVRAPDLGKLKDVVVRQYDVLDERGEKMVRSAAAKLEAVNQAFCGTEIMTLAESE